MSEPVLIRVWDNERKPIGYCVEAFDGTFTVHEDHLLAMALKSFSDSPSTTVTVLSTDEVEWHVNQVSWGHSRGLVEVQCVPHSAHLREILLTDEWFLEHQHLYPER